MLKIKGVDAKSILDSRNEKTILVSIKTSVGEFSASAPNGKSKGKHEAKSYKKSLEKDIETLEKFSDYFSEECLEKFEDLKRVEDILEGHVGANTLFAFEAAVLKAMAKEQKRDVWELIINSSHDLLAKAMRPKIPRLVGNCVGGGQHSSATRKPDFQEFLLIPNLKSARENFEKNKYEKKEVGEILRKTDEKFDGRKNDENAWMTSLNEKEVLDVLKKIKLPIGLDVAASSFFKRKKYNYLNPLLKRDSDEQFDYLSNLIKNFDLVYVEDPFGEEDFESFAKLLHRSVYTLKGTSPKLRNAGAKNSQEVLIVGDDLTVTNSRRLEKAIEMKSINAIIVKPNQCGSLLKVKKVCELARENKIKIVFSHRSGETEEDILADLAFGFQADFFKCGIDGKERESKIRRLMEIEKGMK